MHNRQALMNRSPEYNSASGETPLEREAREFCDALRLAISIAADFRRDRSDDNRERLEAAQESIGRLSPRPQWGHPPAFRLKITPIGEVDSHISKGMEILRDNPGPTIVDVVDAIREDEVVFYSQDDETYMVIFGHEMEIEPVIPDKSSEPGSQ